MPGVVVIVTVVTRIRHGDDPYHGFFDRFGAAFEAEMRAFRAAVLPGGPSLCSGRDALEALRIAVVCYASWLEASRGDLERPP